VTPTLAAMRFGHGLPVPAGAAVTPETMLAALRGPDLMAARWPGLTMAQVYPMMVRIEAARRARRDDEALVPAYRAALAEAVAAAHQGARVTVARSLDATDGLRERLVAFWADHFTVTTRAQAGRALPAAFVDEAVRPHVAGRFGDMLKAATLHPAMLIYLDQSRSVGPGSRRGAQKGRGLNENLAREVIELHTLGVGAGYTQQDVRQMAELLTGLSVAVKQGRVVFDPRAAEPGPETVLGQSYDGEGTGPILAALDDLAVHPATAAHLARKIAVHLVADDPDPGLVAALQAAFARSGGDLMAVYAALLDHPAAWSDVAAKARPPVEFVTAGLRALGLSGADVIALPDKRFAAQVLIPLRAMGQPFQAAPGPDGWPEAAEAWITPSGLSARITWAMTAPSRLVADLPEPVVLARAALGERADARLIWAVERAESRAEAVGLVFAAPAFNRR